MTGWTFRSGTKAGQREKVWAIVRAAKNHTMDTLEILEACQQSEDPKLVNIAFPTIRRIMQQLRDYNPSLAAAKGLPDAVQFQHWECFPMREDIIRVRT